MTRFAVSTPPERASRCLATVANTAGALGLASHVEESTLWRLARADPPLGPETLVLHLGPDLPDPV
jgi:hypothetical protein